MMRDRTARAGDIIQIELLRSELKRAQLTTLIKTSNLEVLQVSVPAGGTVPTHKFPGEAMVHCLQGRVLLLSLEAPHELCTGQILYFPTDAPFAVQGIEGSSLLVTVALSNEGETTELIG